MKPLTGIIVFCIFLFVTQLYIADRTLFGDDFIFATLAQNHQFFYTENAHPPLPVWFDIFFTSLFSLHERTLRLTSIVFSTATVFLVYIFTKKLFGEKIALFAMLISGLSAWHIRASQMNSGSDGGMFTFFFLLTLYFFWMSREKKGLMYTVATGISAGLTLLSKETGFLLFIIISICLLYEIRSTPNKTARFNIFKTGASIILISLVVFSIFPLLDFLYNNHQNMNAIRVRIQTVIIESSSQLSYSFMYMTLFSIFKLLLWIGPFLLFMPFLLKSKTDFKIFNNQNVLLVTALMIIISFYIIVIPPSLDKTRYLMIIIPLLAILAAQTLDYYTANFGKKEWVAICILTFSIILFFSFISTSIHIYSYESKENPLYQLKHVNLNFSIPIFTETDNSGFLLNFSIFFITYMIATLCFVLLLLKNTESKIRLQKYAFILFIAISIGYNFVVAEEYAFHLMGPNYSDAIKELITYSQEHNLKQPLYILKNYELAYYLRDNYTDYVTTYGLSDTDTQKIGQFQQELNDNGGTIMFTDMPPIDKEGLLWQAISTCKRNLTIIDKNIEIGYVFTCEPKKE